LAKPWVSKALRVTKYVKQANCFALLCKAAESLVVFGHVMKEIFTNIFGYAATVVGMALMLPQAYKMYKTKKVEDISWAMLILYFLNCVLWLGYGVLQGSLPLTITNSVGFLISIVQVILKVKFS